jgi:holo-[acyl-carrier protein] synthase
MDRHAGFAERVFTPRERAYAAKKAKPAQHLAAFWAAREAALKAMGCGFRDIDFYDVSVGHDDKGKPVLLLSGLAYRIAQDQAIASFELSISHTADVAIANVVALRKPAPKPAAPIDDKTRLLLDFKRLRTLLDELESKNVKAS